MLEIEIPALLAYPRKYPNFSETVAAEGAETFQKWRKPPPDTIKKRFGADRIPTLKIFEDLAKMLEIEIPALLAYPRKYPNFSETVAAEGLKLSKSGANHPLTRLKKVWS